jgi:hypothetical protein
VTLLVCSGADHADDDTEKEQACGSPAHVHLTGQPFALQQRPVPTLNLHNLHIGQSRDGSQSSMPARPGSQQLTKHIAVENEDESGSLSARSNGSASIGKGPSAFSPRRYLGASSLRLPALSHL